MRCRGFSLLEALVATAILAMVVATSVSLLQGSTAPAEPAGVDLFALAAFADAYVEDPGVFDEHPQGDHGDADAVLSVEWPAAVLARCGAGTAPRPPVSITRLTAHDDRVHRAWLVFRCGGRTVSRCLETTADGPRRTSATSKPRSGRRRAQAVRRRGLTLLELLLAIVVVSMLLIVLVAWMPSAAQATSIAERRRLSHGAVDATFRLIARDFMVGDRRGESDTRVEVLAGDVLRVRTRDRDGDRLGPVVREYRYEPGEHTLEVRDRRPDGATTRRTVVVDVGEWRCELSDDKRAVDLLLRLNDGVERRERLALP